MKKILSLISTVVVSGGMIFSANAGQGVTDKEIVIGSHNDLSGIFSAFGAPAVKAANLYFDEVNKAGGIHGRKIRFVVEDHAYQMPKASQAINKLINRDRVFAMFLSLGTPMNIAAFKLQDRKKIPNVTPLTAARQMLSEPADYKFVGYSSYYDQMRAGVRYFSKKGVKTACSMYIPSDFGLEIKEGTKEQAIESKMAFGGVTTHKPDDLDFVGSLTKLKEKKCDLITLALGVRQVITVTATAKKIGWNNVNFIVSMAGFHTAVAKAPGGITENLHAAAGWSDIEKRIATTPELKAWVEKYKKATGKPPGSGALLGRTSAEILVRGLRAAGKNLTPDSFKKGMESLNYQDPIGDATVSYTAEKHEGSRDVIISAVKGGVWQEITRITSDEVGSSPVKK